MTTIPLWMRRLLIGTAWVLLALGLVAGLLSAAPSATTEYLPILRAATAAVALGIGYLLGQALRPLGRWRPPVPVLAESVATPKGSLGRVWLRGIAAGFWLLVALGTAFGLLAGLLIASAGLSPWISILILAVVAVLLVPLAIARAMVAGGESLPRWTLAVSAAAGFGRLRRRPADGGVRSRPDGPLA